LVGTFVSAPAKMIMNWLVMTQSVPTIIVFCIFIYYIIATVLLTKSLVKSILYWVSTLVVQ
jgi:hypothetical protein